MDDNLETSYVEAVKENKTRDLSTRANSPHLTWWARWASVVTPVLLAASLTVAGYVADRVITHIDKLGEQQNKQAQEQTEALYAAKTEVAKSVSDVHDLVTILRGDTNVMNGHFTDVITVLNQRIEALSVWTRKNSDDIDKLREKVLGKGGE